MEKLFPQTDVQFVNLLLWHSPDCRKRQCCMLRRLDSVRTKRRRALRAETRWTLVTQPQSIGQWRRHRTDLDGRPKLSPKLRGMFRDIRKQPQFVIPKKNVEREGNEWHCESISNAECQSSPTKRVEKSRWNVVYLNSFHVHHHHPMLSETLGGFFKLRHFMDTFSLLWSSKVGNLKSILMSRADLTFQVQSFY